MLSIMPTQQPKQIYPAIACVTAALLWGVLWYPLRVLQSEGVSGLWATLSIYLVASIFVLQPCWRYRQKFQSHIGKYVLLALTAGWTNLAFILAMLNGEVVRVLILFYLSPVWAILLARIALNEHFNKSTFFSLLLAIPGVAFMLWNPDFFVQPITLADIYALSSGFAFALTNILIRKIGPTHWSVKIGVAWFGVIALCIAGICLTGSFSYPVFTDKALIVICLTGFPFMLVMTWTAQYGVTYLPIRVSSILFLMEIIAGAVSAAWLTNEHVSFYEILGGMFIIAAGLVGIWKQNVSHQ